MDSCVFSMSDLERYSKGEQPDTVVLYPEEKPESVVQKMGLTGMQFQISRIDSSSCSIKLHS